MTFGIVKHITLNICENVEQAIERGFSYNKPEIKPIDIERFVIVAKGTKAKKPTVDIVLKDERGQRYVVMITGALLESVVAACQGVEE